MNKLKNFKPEIIYIFSVLILSGFFYFSGCANNTVAPPTNTLDTNIVKFDSLDISPYLGSSANTSAVNIYNGKVVQDGDPIRDINMRDSMGQAQVYYLRSGDLNTIFDALGYKTLFRDLQLGTMTRAQFDAISKITIDHDPLVESDFPDNSTIGMGCFNASKGQNRVFAFYLKGKFDVGVAPRVFGLIYLEYGHAGGPLPPSETISVRFNKAGNNKFTQ